MDFSHGGDWAAFEQEYGALPLDFSASLSPFGMPEAVRAAAAEAIRDAERYPDPRCRSLCAALSERHGVPAEQIVCGAGAAELIYRIARTLQPKHALLPAPTFSEYACAVREVGGAVRVHPLRDLRLDASFLDAIEADTDLVFLCQPNNPTGLLADGALLRRVLRRCEDVGAVLVADECFLDFAAEPERFTLLGALAGSKNLVILKAFTKTCAMAGLRLGYALCGDPALAARLRSCGQPWAVSTPAQAAGLAALRERDYEARLRDYLQTERPRVQRALCDLGFRVLPGEANFLLFFSTDPDLDLRLKPRGILIRSCADFPGLGKGWYRIAIRRREENDALLRALREV